MNKKPSEYLQSLCGLHIPRWEELPELNLYMDQVLAYLNGRLEPLNPDPTRPLLTASMVNNYVKNSIVRPPVKKHYKTYHLAYLMVVILMKRCYSLQEIGTLIRIYSNIEDKDRISRDYNKFVSVFEESLKDVLETGVCARTYYSDPTREQILMINVIRTLAYKIYADVAILEAQSTDLDPADPQPEGKDSSDPTIQPEPESK